MTNIEEKISALRTKLQSLESEKKILERAAKQTQRIKQRKAENQQKFEIGGLCKLSGLFDIDRGALLGALLSLPPLLADPDRFSVFKRAGDTLLKRRERDRNKRCADETYLQ